MQLMQVGEWTLRSGGFSRHFLGLKINASDEESVKTRLRFGSGRRPTDLAPTANQGNYCEGNREGASGDPAIVRPDALTPARRLRLRDSICRFFRCAGRGKKSPPPSSVSP